jgi:hypothetical protein
MLIIQLVSLSNSFFYSFHRRMYYPWEYVYIWNTTFFLSVSLSLSSLIAVSSSHQVTSNDEHRYHRQSRHSRDATMTNEDSSLSGTPHSSAHNRSRPMPTSYTYWLNSGDNNNNLNANFMRPTYAATSRSRVSRSVERCPRACRGILSHFQLI